MLKIVLALVMLLPFAAHSQVVHLDCTGEVKQILGEELYGKSNMSVGDEQIFLVDIDLEKETGKIGNWSSSTFSTNPNDPNQILKIGEKQISFGILPPNGDWGVYIDREDLSFDVMIGFGAIEVIKGKCKLVEKREAPKRAF